jgi:hypothetical protein
MVLFGISPEFYLRGVPGGNTDINFSTQQANFHFLNARLAPEVLFHPVGSKVSSHAFDGTLP